MSLLLVRLMVTEEMVKILRKSMGKVNTMDYDLENLVEGTELVKKFQLIIKAINEDSDLTNTDLEGTDLATIDTVDMVINTG